MTHPLLGRYEREITASILFHMVQDGHQFPMTTTQISAYVQKAATEDQRHLELKRKYLHHYERWYANARSRWLWTSIATLGLANLLGYNPQPEKPSMGYYGITPAGNARKRMDNFLDRHAKPPRVMLPLVRGMPDIWEGIAEIRDRQGLLVKQDGDEHVIHLLPPLERLFAAWQKPDGVTAH